VALMPIVTTTADALSRFVESGPLRLPSARWPMPPPAATARVSLPAGSASPWRAPLTAPGPVWNLGPSVAPPLLAGVPDAAGWDDDTSTFDACS
jgi:hypothetical protein